MEKVKDLTRKHKERKLTKLKINLEKDGIVKVLEKIFSFVGKDLDGVDLVNTNPTEYLKFKHFRINVVSLSERDSDRIKQTFARKETSKVKGYLIQISDLEGFKREIYTVPQIKIRGNSKHLTWRLNSTSGDRIWDIRDIYGVLKIIELVNDEYENNPLFDDNFNEVSYFNNSYSAKEVTELLNLNKIIPDKKCSPWYRWKENLKLNQYIVDNILFRQNTEYNIELMEKYNRESRSEVARAFETKLNIPEKVQAIMNDNKFLKTKDFSFVELDQETDLEKLSKIEMEYLKVRELFKDMKIAQSELRFRKLGKHRALGVYFYTLKCICVDITSPASFMHELGHHMDYTLGNVQLSTQLDFYPIALEYKRAYDKYLFSHEGETVEYLKRKKDYFFAPTEIFARMFEVYLVEKGVDTSFLKDKEDMTMNRGYVSISKTMLKTINNYFDTVLKLDFEAFNSYEYKEVKKRKNSSKTKVVNIEEIQYSSKEQLSFGL